MSGGPYRAFSANMVTIFREYLSEDYGAAPNKDLGIIPQNSGFYIMRNNREIMKAETFEFYKKHPDYSHFRAEIEFDGSLDATLHSDVKKMTITPPKSVLDKIQAITSGMIQESGRKGRKRANVNKGSIDHFLAEGNIKRRSQLIPKPKTLLKHAKSKESRERMRRKMAKNPEILTFPI